MMNKFSPGDRVYAFLPDLYHNDIFEVLKYFPMSEKVHVRVIGENYTTSFYEDQLEHKAVVESPLWQELL